MDSSEHLKVEKVLEGGVHGEVGRERVVYHCLDVVGEVVEAVAASGLVVVWKKEWAQR